MENVRPDSGEGVMTAITPEQRQAAAEAGDSPVELADPQTGRSYILLRAEVFRELLEWGEDRRQHEAWAGLARQARDEWARENPY
jgi:hypothetical protein